MIDFSQFDSLIAMTMYFIADKQSWKQDGVLVRTKTSFALIADSITAPHAKMESSVATSANAISLAGSEQFLRTATSHL